MLNLLVQRTFSVGGTLLVCAVLLVPFFIAWLVSVYENRLLAYFSEGTEVLTKGNIVASVLTSTVVPCFMVSFGLLGVSSLFGNAIGFANFDEAAGIVTPSTGQTLVYVPLTLAVSVAGVLLARRIAYRGKLTERPVEGALFRRWVAGLNIVGQVLILALLWISLYAFPAQANVPLK